MFMLSVHRFSMDLYQERNLKCQAVTKISVRRAAQSLPEMTIICSFTARVKMSSSLLSVLQK